MKNLLEIGKVVRPKGLDGTVKVQLFSKDASNLLKQKSFLVGEQELTVQKSYIYDECLYVQFKEVQTIEGAEELKWHIIYLPREKASKLKKGEMYAADLLGLWAFNEVGEEIGKIAEVNDYGATPIITFKTRTGEVLCPAVPGLIIAVKEQNDEKTAVLNQKLYDEVTK